jgi:hypothetical protein
MAELVGYKLIRDNDDAEVQSWGGVWGQCPGIPNPLIIPDGPHIHGGRVPLDTDLGGYRLVAWMMDKPVKTLFDGADFLDRLTNEEYEVITASTDVQMRRWLDIFRLRGEIDVTGVTAQAAKAGLVALNLLTQERADELFAVA